MNLKIDPSRTVMNDGRACHHLNTTIYVRAQLENGRWGTADIACLDRASLIEWLRSRGGENTWAENVALVLLGHAPEAGGPVTVSENVADPWNFEATAREVLYKGAVAWMHGWLDGMEVAPGITGAPNSIDRLQERIADHLPAIIGVSAETTAALRRDGFVVVHETLPAAATATREGRVESLCAAIREARALIDAAGPHEDPMCYVVEVLDNALEAHGTRAPAMVMCQTCCGEGQVALGADGDDSEECETCEGAGEVAATPATPEGGRDCTCKGSCGGIGGLAPGWRCSKLGREATDDEREAYRLAVARLARIAEALAAPGPVRDETQPPPGWEQYTFSDDGVRRIEAWRIYDAEHPSAAPASSRAPDEGCDEHERDEPGCVKCCPQLQSAAAVLTAFERGEIDYLPRERWDEVYAHFDEGFGRGSTADRHVCGLINEARRLLASAAPGEEK